MNNLHNILVFPSLKWFSKNSWGILGASTFLSLGLVAITIFILFHRQDYKKLTAIILIFLSFISISFSFLIYVALLRYTPALII